jgi:hypothetical protein
MAPFPWLQLTFRQQGARKGVPARAEEQQSALMNPAIEWNFWYPTVM